MLISSITYTCTGDEAEVHGSWSRSDHAWWSWLLRLGSRGSWIVKTGQMQPSGCVAQKPPRQGPCGRREIDHNP